MRSRRQANVKVAFCDRCSTVCDPRCRAQGYHDARMLTLAQMRTSFIGGRR